MADVRVRDIGDFRVQEYGDGSTTTLCIGGMSYAPDDFSKLAQLLPGKVSVADNPFQVGRIPWTQTFVAELRVRYASLVEALRPSMIIAHSCGSFDALHLMDDMPSVECLALLTPPNGTRAWAPESSRMPEYEFLDRCLADLCKDIPDELYREMLERHKVQYAPTTKAMKTLYKHEMPERRRESISGIIELLRNARKDILIIFGNSDPWMLVDPGTVDYGQKTTVRRMDAGHFPHVSEPEQVATLIAAWMSARREGLASTARKPQAGAHQFDDTHSFTA